MVPTSRVVEPGYAVDCAEVHPAPRQGFLERLVFPITDQGDTRAGELSIPWGCSCQPGCRAERSEAGEGSYLISLGFRYRQLSNRSQRPPDVA
jgi:hypothetical protein